MSRNDGHQQKLERGKKRLLEPPEGTWPCQSLHAGLLAERTEKEQISVFGPPMFFLLQPLGN
jgi:hypothetical protein